MTLRALTALAWVLCAAACASGPPVLGPDTHAVVFARDARLGSEHIQVQLVRASGTAGRRPLVLYATGDGGWRSADRGLFQHLALWGYPLAGFSARHYLEHLRFEATTSAHVAEDYEQLIAFARKTLALPGDTPTVLVGFSRGSGLAVVAAGQPGLQPLLGGVLAVALTEDEEYVRDERTSAGRAPRKLGDRRLATLRPYEMLADLGHLPLAVVQSTKDAYLPAARARQLFGPDNETRRFFSVTAGSHTFGGAREALYEQARLALEWITARDAGAAGPGSRHARSTGNPL